MSQRIHSRVSNLFRRESFHKFRIYDCHIRRNVKVCKRIFHARLIICDDGERRNLCRCSGGRRYGCEFGLLSQFREVKRHAQIFKRGLRIFIECPHGLSCIDWRSSSHRYDPVWLKSTHCLSAFHNRLNRWIWLNAFKQFYFHTAFLQISDGFIQESLTLH